MVIYKNILRALDNIGKNVAYVVKYYYNGQLSSRDMESYLQSQILAIEYMNQAANFSPMIRRLLAAVRDGANYKNLANM